MRPDETILCVCFGIRVARVPFEVFLGDSDEGERSDRAFKNRRGHSPGTAGAAPAAEIIAVDTNEALTHKRLPFIGIASLLATDGIPHRGREPCG